MSEERHSALGIRAAQGSATAGTPTPRRGPIVRRGLYALLAVVLLLGIGGARTLILRVVHARALAAATATQAVPFVTVIQAKESPDQESLQLPGTLLGAVESPIYARANGYLRRWYRDIGSEVAKGDLLAEIDTPEIDQQLSQSIAAREQAVANLDLTRTSFERWENLRSKDVVSQQELDERRGAYAQAQANLAAAEAGVRRLQELASFKRVVAPFSGVVTRRNVDVGDLVDAGNGGAGRALFVLSQVDPLRLYVFVPQAYAQLVHAGQDVTVTQPELPGSGFAGRIARTAGAIDTQTRTLQVEITLPNANHRLLPGAFVQVSLHATGRPALTVPTNALLFRGDGIRVAVVDGSSHVKLRPVTVGRDFGTRIEILDGIGSTDRLVVNPADSLADGDEVRIASKS
ncbi:MAG TPA: efflux RND transporter periplasmic adaptor subunit [Burkholderiaceae bacterium]|nr:efflux RND transporter periplasmic adaptor subunit [Burkholderiaceae bacterium]